MASGKFTEATRSAIRERAKGRCEVCGFLIANTQIHHRKPRGMGGSRAVEVSSASNGLYVCRSCHEMIESNRERAYMMGWLVRRQMQPHSREVRLWDGWFVLTADGGRLPVEQDP